MEYGYCAGGEFLTQGEPLEVRACFDGAHVATTFRPPARLIEAAVQATTSAAVRCASLPSHRRAEILRRISEAVAAESESFVRMLALEAGKPVKAGRVEVERCVFNLRNAAEEALRIESEFLALDRIPAGEGRWAVVRRFPLGTVLAITPFNFPLNLVAHKLAPAIASGNSIVQKPATKTPICSLMLARIACESGLPEGALSVLPCSGSEAGKLADDPRFGLVTFTGSAAVGWELKRRAGRKRVTLELGGNAGVIVHSDSDVEDAASRCASGGFSFSGQSCIAVQRILVHREVFGRFRDTLVDRVRTLVTGDPLDDSTDVGPLIEESEAKRVEQWVSEAVAGGATVLTGGRREGTVYQPTVLTGTRPDMKVNCEEIFGPVVTFEAYDDFTEALHSVNDSRYGLQAGVFTSDVKRVFQAFETLHVGGVVANDVPTFRADHMPYGGVKDSGTGREGARYAIEEMTERRILVLNLQ